MTAYAIVIETGYKTTSPNYRISLEGPLEEPAARTLFASLRAGTDSRLPAAKQATVVDVSDRQFLRLRQMRGATVMDRVTIGPAATTS